MPNAAKLVLALFLSMLWSHDLAASEPVAASGSGQELGNPDLTKTFMINAGAFHQFVDATANRSRRDRPLNADVNLSDLGLDENYTSFVASARVRFADRWRLEGSVFETDLSGGGSASTEIEFGDLTIPVGGEARVDLAATVYVLDVGYSFYKTETAELGVTLGGHIFDVDAGISGSAFIGGTNIDLGSAEGSVIGPLPNIGVYGTYAIDDHWSINGSAGYFDASIDDYSGELVTVGATVKYWPKDWFAMGLGYRFLSANLDIDDKDKDYIDTFDVTWHGPFLFASLAF